jgi:hypothetical protein
MSSTSLRLIDDFRWVLGNAWSVRFNVLGAVFGGLAATLGVLAAKDVELPVGPITLAVALGAATGLASLAALAARFVKQDRPNADGSE